MITQCRWQCRYHSKHLGRSVSNRTKKDIYNNKKITIVADTMITNLLKLNSIGQSVRHVLINIRELDKTKIPVGKF